MTEVIKRSVARFHVQTIRHPKNVAKSLKQFLDEMGNVVKLSKAQSIVAALYGYKDWHDLEQSVSASVKTGPLDSELDATQLASRYTHCVGVLSAHGIPGGLARLLLDKTRPTGGERTAFRDLKWTLNSDGLWETSDKDFRHLRIYPGHPNPRRDSLRTSKALRDDLIGNGYTAISIYKDAPQFDSAYLTGQTVEAIKSEVEERWQYELQSAHELRMLNRLTVENDDESLVVGIRDRMVTSITTVAEGMYLLDTDKHTYITIDANWLRKLPDAFRPADIEDDSVHDYLFSESGAFIALCFPNLFTKTEVTEAGTTMHKMYPDAYRVLILGDMASPRDIAKGSRGFATLKIEYHYMDEVGTSEDGSVIVLAAIGGTFGVSDGSEEAIFEQIHMFKVAATAIDEVRMTGTIDQDDHEFLGVHELSMAEYRQSKNDIRFT